MSESGPLSTKAGMGQPSGKLPMLLAFILGALCALVLMYFFDGRSGGAGGSSRSTTAVEETRTLNEAPALSGTGSPRFASRLTYELSQVPEYRTSPFAETIPAAPGPAVSPSQPRVATTVSPSTAAGSTDAPAAGERVANARPITTAPPEPKERGRPIEKEPDDRRSREPARETKTPAPPAAARVIEGREVELRSKPPDTPTRPIVANPAVDTRAEIEAERKRRGPETPRQPPASADTKAIAPRMPGGSSPPVPGAALGSGADTASGAPAKAAPDSAAGGAPRSRTGYGAADATAESIQRRLESSREWLASAPPTTYTIQLMGTAGEDQLKSELKSLSRVLDAGKLYIFRTTAQGKPSITVVYGAYADRQSAHEALGSLPPAVAANRPVLRTVNGIRAELKQHGVKADAEEHRQEAAKPAN